MAARKLQTEVDRTLKRVGEGVDAFQEQYAKLQASTNQTQKEKIEADLKQQIKRLQRLRDSIKTWLGSNEIKDKQPLTDARKLIETQMELFKACEKEMKTKAFSKEGLSAAVKLDPMDVLKEEMSNFVSDTVTELGRQIEVAEAEVESLQGGAKKKRGVPNERIAEVEALNERRRWHVSRLELILRLLENNQIAPTKVSDIQTDVKYFLESNTEEDFVEDEGIYDDLDLEQTEEQFGMAQDDLQSSHDTSSVADATDFTAQPPAPRTPAKEAAKGAAAKAAPTTIPEDPTERSPAASANAKKAAAAAAPAAAARKSTLDGTSTRPTAAQIKGTPALGPTPRTAPPPVQPVRYSVAAAAAVAPSTPAASVQQTPVPVPAPAPLPSSSAAPAVSPPPASAPTPAASVTSPRGVDAVLASSAKPLASVASAAQSSASPAPSSVSAVSAPAPPPSAPSASGASPASASVALPSPPPSSMLPLAEPARPGSAALPDGSVSPAPSSTSRVASNSLGDLLTTFESAKNKAQRGAHDLGAIHQVLQAGYSNIPQPQDAERPRHYAPKVPYPTPEYYPQQPTTQLESPAMFAKLDIDTLFYIFYYQPGTYSQYLAAQELKAKSWRFHTSYLTWFQRAQEPDTITDEYEQGVYHYFDWESGWSSRRKTGFRFEYKALEAF